MVKVKLRNNKHRQKKGIILRQIYKSYKINQKQLDVLQNINLDIKPFEFISILGPIGCGKTTILNLIAGFEKCYSGLILINGKKVVCPDKKKGFVFQEPSLFPWRTVLGNVSMGLETNSMSKRLIKKITFDYLKKYGLWDYKDMYPYQLSGGMQQKVAIIRSLIADPDIILMDEPFKSLDTPTKNLLQDELVGLWQKTKKTIILVTHDISEAVYLSDKIVVLTNKPAKIKFMCNIKLKRPRDRFSNKIKKIENNLFHKLKTEVDKNEKN